MKLKDLLKGRDKLRKYDELKAWRDRFNNATAQLQYDIQGHCHGGCQEIFHDIIPYHIKTIIIDAFDAEIKKMEEE